MRSFISLVVAFSMLSSGIANANIIGKNGEVFFRYHTGQERGAEVPPPSHQTSDITAHFVGVVGFPFSEKIPLVPGKTITSWSLISGSVPRGLSFDPSTGIVSGNPETPVRGAVALAQGYDAAGAKAAIAEISIDTFKPNNQSRQVDFYAHTNHYQFQQLPVPGGMTVDHWNIIFTPPPGVDVVGRNYDGTPTAPGRYPIAAQGFDFLNREQLLLTGYYTVEDGPTFAAISDDIRPVPQNPGYQSFNDSPPPVRSVGGGAVRYMVEVKAGDVLPGSVNAEVVQPKGVRLFGDVGQPYQTASVRYKAVDTDGTIGYSNWWKIGTSNPQPDFNATTLGPFDLTVGTYVEIPFGTRGTPGAKNFTVATGTLPAGLTLDAVSGIIRGTPTTVETQTGISLRLAVTNNGNVDATNSVPFTIRVFPKAIGLAIADANPNPVNVRVNAPFTATVTPTGDTIEPYTLSVDASTLPVGMTFDPSTGIVGGSIPVAGRYSTVFHLVNGDGRTADATLRVGVYNPLTISPVSDITVAQYDAKTPLESFSYDAQGVMPSTDGTSVPEIFLIGSFPAGIWLDTVNDAISGGTTKPPGTYGPFALQIKDGSGDTATTDPFSIVVTPRAALSVTVSPVVEVHYHLQASVNPVVSLVRPPLSTALNLVYSLDGTLPDGLSFDPATGVISGKPSRTGTFPNLVLHVQDGDGPAYGATSEPFVIDVTPPGPLTAQAVPAVTTVIGTPIVIPAPTFVNVVGELAFVSATPLPAGLRFDIPTGTISGSPTELVSAQDVSVMATDEAGRTATASLSLTILPQPTADLGALGTEWTMARFETKSFQINARNLIGTPTYAITGTLPTGLSLNSSTGVISGTASTEGVSNGLAVRVTDAATGLSAVTPDFSITVGPRQPLTIGYATTVVYANSPAGMPMRPTTQNAHGAVVYSLASGSLPDGLTLQPDTGFVVGQATTPGDFAFSVSGVDTDNSRSTANVALRVSLFGNVTGPEQIDAGTWRVDEHFASAPIVYSNAIPPLSFFVDEAMPNGLVLNPADGSISGAISSSGDYRFAVRGLDAQGRGADATVVTASIKDPLVVDAQPLSVTTTQYADTSIMIAPTFANAIGSLTYAMAGDLPSGVSFDQSTGVISGKPAARGTFPNITITATDSHDSSHATSQPFTITVLDRNALTASLPSRAITLANRDIADIASVRVTNASYGDAVTYSYTGVLPAGVSFDAASGAFHGTATELGDFPGIFVMVSDSVGAKATAGPLTIHSQTDGDPITLSMADVVTKVGFPFTTPAPVVGNNVGTPHFYTQDSIPQISLSTTTGQLSGIFATVQDLNYDVFVSDQTDRTTSERLAILVTPVLRIVAPTIVPVTQGTAAGQAVEVSYAAGAVVYSKGAGNWPAGVSVNPTTGAIVGTPTAATGTYAGLTISGTDTFGSDATGKANVDTQQSNVFSIRVNPTTATPHIANVPGNKLIFGTVGVAAAPFEPTVTDSAAGKPWIYEGTTYTLNHDLAADTGLSFDPATGVISGTPTSAIIYRDLTITVTSQLGDSSTTAPFWFGVAPKDAITPTAGQVTKYYNRIDKGYSSNPLLWDNLIGNKTYTPQSGVTATFDYTTGVFTDGPEGPNVLAGQPAGGWPSTTIVKDEFGRTGSITQYYFNMSPLGVTVPSSTVAVVIGAAGTNINVPTVTGRYGTLSYTATGLPAGLQVSPATGAVSGTIAAGYSGPASVSVTVTVTDTYEVSTTKATVSYTLTVSSGPITAKSGQQTTYNTRLGAAFSTSAPLFDNTVGAVTYASSALTSGGTFNSATGVITGPYTGSGTNTVTITATDSTGRTGTLVVVVNINPALTLVVSSPTTSLNMGQSYTNINTPTATSVVGTASYTATGLPAGMTISPTTGSISGTVQSSYAGGTTFPVVVTVTDSFDGSTKTAGYTLMALSGPITATAGQQTAYKTRLGAAFSTSAPLFDNTVGGVTYTSSALAPGGSFNGATGVVSGPYTVTGTNTVTITARDSTGRTGTFTVAVTISSAMTVTVSSPTTSLGVGTTYTSINTPTTTNVLGVASYAATGLPAGFTINANGSISGKLALGTAVGQTYPVTITVTDSYDGSSKSTSYTLTATGVLQVAAGQKTYYAVRVDRAWATDPIVVYNGVGTVSFAKYPGQGGNINASTGSYYQTGPQNGSAVINGQPAGGWLNTAVISDSRGSINFNAYIESLWGLATSIPTTMLAPRIGVTYTNINVPSTATLYGTASYVVSGLPTGMSFNAATGSISGTIPASVAAGSTFPVTVTVTDSRDGATASTSYTLTATP